MASARTAAPAEETRAHTRLPVSLQPATTLPARAHTHTREGQRAAAGGADTTGVVGSPPGRREAVRVRPPVDPVMAYKEPCTDGV